MNNYNKKNEKRCFDSKFEQELATELVKHLLKYGIQSYFEFRMPGSRHIFDFLIIEPPRGIIEIAPATISSDRLNRLVETVEKVHSYLGPHALVYLVVKGTLTSSNHEKLLNKGIRLIEGDTVEIIVYKLANDFKSFALTMNKKSISSLLNKSEENYSLNWLDQEELIPEFHVYEHSISALLTEEDFEIVKSEFFNLRSEWIHNHYTAAALRMGRCLEYVLYSACKSWGIYSTKPVLKGIETLKGDYEQLRQALIEFLHIDDNISTLEDKNRKKKSLLGKRRIMNDHLDDIIGDLNDVAKIKTKGDISQPSILTLREDIFQQYAKLSEVRKTIISIENPMIKLNELRNKSAHASQDGKSREVTREELCKMLDYFNQVLEGLVRCGTSIVNEIKGFKI